MWRWNKPETPEIPAPAPAPEVKAAPPTHALTDALPDPALILARNGWVLHANPGAAELLGQNPQGQHVSATIRAPVILDAVSRVLEGNGPLKVEFERRVPLPQHYEAWIAPILGHPDGPAILISLKDLTREQMIERMRADFVANASHELRTPLAVLKANIELLTLQAGGVLPSSLQRIERSVLNMQLIAETLLWMSRERPEPLPEEDIDLSALVGELIDKHRYLIGNRDIELLVDIHSEPCRLPPTACRIVIGNFLRNALQYAEEGQVEISFNYPRLVIANHIREAKPREESSDYGYGLGLQLMRQLCAKLGWQIDVILEQQRFTVALEFTSLQGVGVPGGRG